jgi:NAD+ kinase
MLEQPPARLGIITKPDEPRATVLAREIARWAAQRGLSLLVNDSLSEIPAGALAASPGEMAERSDLLIVLGGDGTMIGTARLVAGRGTPVLGVNLGSLGYLTEFAVEDALPTLEEVSKGNFEVDRRMMLDWRVRRAGEEVGAGTALNDVVVNKSALARIIEINCTVGAHYVTTYRADGLIVATPTGSTAYNLSAGGPIICPGTEALSICPICPHTLTNRPLLLPDTAEIRLQINTREQEVMITSDGQTGMPLMAGDEVEVNKSSKTFNTIRPKHKDYFEILRNKLKWSGR